MSSLCQSHFFIYIFLYLNIYINFTNVLRGRRYLASPGPATEDIKRLKWIMDIVNFDVLTEQDIDLIIAVELLKLKDNKILMGRIEKEGLIGWLKVRYSNRSLFEKSVPFLVFSPSGWFRRNFLQQMIYSQRNVIYC